MLADTVVFNKGASQVSTGNAEGFDASGLLAVFRCAIVAGAARTDIICATPSCTKAGQTVSVVIARAMACPWSPITTHDAFNAVIEAACDTVVDFCDETELQAASASTLVMRPMRRIQCKFNLFLQRGQCHQGRYGMRQRWQQYETLLKNP